MVNRIEGPKTLKRVERRHVATTPEAMVAASRLPEGTELPVVLRPNADGVDLAAWIAESRDRVESWVESRGGVLLRGFAVPTAEYFERVAQAFFGELMEYTHRSTPRREVSGRVYTSTEYPADRSIPLHNEMSYTRSWPMRIAFFCAQPAASGGATPIADSRRVFQAIEPAVRHRFVDKGVLYARNYSRGLDLPWEDVFQTDDRAEVERFCREAGIEVEWKADGSLRTRQVCQGAARHPRTGEMVWFNQAHLFHISSLDSEVRELLLEEAGEENLPRNAYYGDGTPIEEEALAHIREVLDREAIPIRWQSGDVLLLDNMLVAHARDPYTGPRRVLVAMGGACALGPDTAPEVGK